MANLKEVKSRIKSASNTAKVTRAMQMVSASKSKAKQVEVERASDYAREIRQLVNSLNLDKSQLSWYQKKSKVETIGMVVIGSSRGLVGGLTATLASEVRQFLTDLRKNHPEVKVEAVSVQKMGLKILNLAGLKGDYHFGETLEKIEQTGLTAIAQLLEDKFKRNIWNEIYLVYPKFENLLNFNPTIEKILPVELEKTEELSEVDERFVFEPSKETILDELMAKYFENQLIFGILNSNASEQGARMMAMKTATDNASELIGQLRLEYNKQRQAKITQQIIEVAIGGKLA
jgi:F-type H+-transporting ATPase subunit gamma